MTKQMITIFNAETGEEITREMNKAELAQYEEDQITAAAYLKELADKAAAKEALLKRLGITAEEATLLLG